MPFPQRLPIVNGDDGQWGDIIDQFLRKEHYDDGTDNAVNGGHQTVTIRAGTATAGTAPLKFTSGTLLTSPEAGAVEFLTDKLYFTITTGTVRKTVAIYDDSSGTTGDIYYRNSSGIFTRLGIGSSGDVLQVSGGLPTWSPGAMGATGPAGATGATGPSTVADNVFTLQDNGDATKQMKFELSGISTATTRTVTVPDASGTMTLLGNASTGSGSVVLASSPTITTPVLTGLPTGSGVDSAATASTLAARDSNASLTANSFIASYTTTVTSASAVNLSVSSTELQAFSGSSNQTVNLPATNTLVLGQQFVFINNSSGTITVQSSGGFGVKNMAASTTAIFTCVNVTPPGTANGNWVTTYVQSPSGTVVGTTDTQTLTNKTFTDSTTTIQDDGDNTKQFQFQASGITTSTTRTLTVPDASTTIVGTDATQILTNKQVSPREQTVSSASTVTPSADANDIVTITAQAAALTLANPSPASNVVQGQKLIIRIKDNGTARAISYGTQYRALGNALPTTTVISKTLYLGLIYNATDTKWDLVAVSQEA